MIPKFTKLQFIHAKSKDLLKLECKQCKTLFSKTKHEIQRFLNPKQNRTGDFCSQQCHFLAQHTKQSVICKNCNKEFFKLINQIIKSPNHFCTRSCAASFNNKNKSFGTRRSKLEKWVEQHLSVLYPNLQIDYNKKSAIKSELDIYIPSLNLAFELNGIFHYEPIYGVNKFNKIKTNDVSKSKECHKVKIDLCIIDTSQQSYVTPKTSQKYIDIIVNIIKSRIEGT